MGITTVGDFLRYYPREYDEYTEPVGVSQVTAGKKCAVMGRIERKSGRAKYRQTYHSDCHVKRRKFFLAAYVVHMPFYAHLQSGGFYIFRGMVTDKNGRKTMEQPEIFKREDYKALLQSLPHLRADKGINQPS